MKNFTDSKNRFQLSERCPDEYPVLSNDDAVCVDVARALGESNMKFILARRHQLGMQAIKDAYGVVKESLQEGKCHDPRRLFNFLLTKNLKERNQI